MVVETVDIENDPKHTTQPSSVTASSKEAGNITVITAEDDLDGDEGLHELGYKAELHRTRGFRETFSMSLTCRYCNQNGDMQVADADDDRRYGCAIWIRNSIGHRHHWRWTHDTCVGLPHRHLFAVGCGVLAR